jgi:hypothetical protein
MKKNIIIILLIVGMNNLFAQETKKEQTSPEPLELPNFIIQGNLQLNVNSGIKQSPEKPKPLTSSELDSLNSLEKQSSQSLPVEQLITNTIVSSRKDGFVKAQFGRFATGQLDAGYGTLMGSYDLYAQAGYEFSDGHINNADFSKFNVKLTSDFIAPQKFFIFGGSRTRSQVEFKNNAYNLFSSPLALKRDVNNLIAKVDVDGNYNGFKFETGAGYNGFQLITDNFKNADNNIYGYLKVNNIWNNFIISGNLLLDLHSLRGQATNFIQADGAVSVFNGNLSVTGNAGLQWATNSDGIDRGGLLISGLLEYRFTKLFTVRADIRSGLENKKFRELAYSNPYISNMANFDYAYDIMNLGANLIFHPNEYLGVSAGFRVRKTDRYPIFEKDMIYYQGSFGLNYQSISLFQSIFEAYWYMSPTDKLIANLTVSQSSLSDFDSKNVPYIPSIQFSLTFKKTWSEELGTDFGVDYIGNRFADLQNTNEINSYINLKVEGNYKLYDGLRAFLKFDNLLNSDIYIWEGYRERNVFVTFGVMWQF